MKRISLLFAITAGLWGSVCLFCAGPQPPVLNADKVTVSLKVEDGKPFPGWKVKDSIPAAIEVQYTQFVDSVSVYYGDGNGIVFLVDTVGNNILSKSWKIVFQSTGIRKIHAVAFIKHAGTVKVSGTKDLDIGLKPALKNGRALKMKGKIFLDSSFTLIAEATGYKTLTYTWYKGDTIIQNENRPVLQFDHLSMDDKGKYRCIVSSLWGADTSFVHELVPKDPQNEIHILTQPQNLTVKAGSYALFRVLASGDSVRYQWQRNGWDIPNATINIYEIQSVTTADNGAVFRCVISNPIMKVVSQEAMLTVIGKKCIR